MALGQDAVLGCLGAGECQGPSRVLTKEPGAPVGQRVRGRFCEGFSGLDKSYCRQQRSTLYSVGYYFLERLGSGGRK